MPKTTIIKAEDAEAAGGINFMPTEDPTEGISEPSEEELEDLEKELDGDAGETEGDDAPAPELSEEEIEMAAIAKEKAEADARSTALAQRMAELENKKWLRETEGAYNAYTSERNPLVEALDAASKALADFDTTHVNPRQPVTAPKAVKVSASPASGASASNNASREPGWEGRDFSVRMPNAQGRQTYWSQWTTQITPEQHARLVASPVEGIEVFTPTLASLKVQGRTVHGEIAARMLMRAVFGKSQPVTPVAWGTTKHAFTASPIESAAASLDGKSDQPAA